MATSKSTSKKRSKWLRRFVFLLGFAALLWFAPALVGLTPLRNTIAQSIFADLKGTVTVSRASLGWLSPIVLHDLKLHDEHGQLVLHSPRVASSKQMLQLLQDKIHLGKFEFENPTVHWRLAENSSNIEKVFDVWLFPSADGGGENVEVDVEFNNTVLHVYDEKNNRQWRLDPVQAMLAVPKSFEKPFRIEIDGKFADGVTGRLRAKMQMQETDAAPCESKVALWIERLPLEMVQPLLARFQPQTKATGRLDCKLKMQWQEGKNAGGRIDGSINVNDAVVSDPWLQGESLRLARIHSPMNVSWNGDEWTVHHAELNCDIGSASAKGKINVSSDPMKWLSQPGLIVNANVDLAKLAEYLPKTLHLQEGTKLLAGKVTAKFESVAHGGGVVWKGDVNTTDLQGVHGEQFFVWKNPIAVTCRARYQADGVMPAIEQFDCKSEFLNIQGAGDSRQWKLHAQYDLDRLAKQIAPFVDLGKFRLSGAGSTNLTLQSNEKSELFLQSDTRFDNLVVAGLTERPIQEKSLVLYLNAAGRQSDSQLGLNTANLRAQIDSDQLDVALLKPITKLSEPLSSPVRLHLTGDLSRWRNRLTPFVPALKQIILRGNVDAETKLQIVGSKIDFDQTRLTLQNLHAHGYGVRMNERKLQVTTSGTWNAGQFQLNDTSLISSALTLKAPQVKVDATAKSMQIDVAANAQGDLARIQQWLQDPQQPPSPLRGRFDGKINIRTKGDQIGFQIDADVKQFVQGPASKPTLKLDHLKAAGRGIWKIASDAVQFEALRIDTPYVIADARGTIEKVSSAKRFNIEGRFQYDWNKLEPLLRLYVGKDLQVTGAGNKPFRLEGTLANGVADLRKWVGTFEMDWQSAKAHGVNVGPAVIKALLKDGWLRFAPIAATMNDGRLTVTPHVKLQPGPLELYVAKGKILENVKITPKMCANVLQYISPALNGMAQAQGKLSMDVDYCRVDLETPAKSRVAGKMTLHAAQLAATPLIHDLATLLKTKPTVGIEKESIVKFQLYEGRLFHENLGLVFPNVTVRTRGAVGLDGKLALLAEFPAPQSWFGDRPIGAAIAKQKIQLPIGGTVDRPQLDRQALASITKRFLRDTTRDVIRSELEKRLKGLFGPK